MENQDWQQIVESLVDAKRCLAGAWRVLDGTDGAACGVEHALGGPFQHRRDLRDRACERLQRGCRVADRGSGVLGEARRPSRIRGRHVSRSACELNSRAPSGCVRRGTGGKECEGALELLSDLAGSLEGGHTVDTSVTGAALLSG